MTRPIDTCRFPFYNKPNGMAHFLRHADPPVEEAVIALVDPDMVFMSTLRPYVGESAVSFRVPCGGDERVRFERNVASRSFLRSIHLALALALVMFA